MLRALRPAALLAVLTVLMLGAMLPAGWMPGANGMPVMCSIDGGKHDAPGPDGNIPDDSGHRHECPFAAAPQLASPPAILALASADMGARIAAPIIPARPAPMRAGHAPQAPRAPPHPV